MNHRSTGTRRAAACIAIALAGALPVAAIAQSAWPDKPVRFIVPLPPGGPSDIVLRGAIEKMQPVLKQPLIVDNKPGAAGNLGASEAARAAPDGYTWLWTTDTLMTVNPHVYKSLAFKPPDGHFKFPHLWPLKFPRQDGADYPKNSSYPGAASVGGGIGRWI